MLDAAEEAVGFVGGRAREDLNDGHMLTLACTRLLEVVGEAGSQVSPESRDQISQVPWNIISGMRNRLIHAYYDINLDVLWQTLILDLPALIPILQDILALDDS